MTEKERMEKAFIIANNVLYFDDSYDYGTALYQICSVLFPNRDEEVGKKYIDLEE